MRPGNKAIARATIGVVVIGMAYASRQLPVADWVNNAAAWRSEFPVEAGLLFVVACIVGGIALVPGWILMMIAGLLFDIWPGFALGVAGIVGGSVAGYLAGRLLARDWIESRVSANPRLAALDDALEEQAFSIIVLTRLALLIPYNLLNYVYGASRVSLPVYALATTVGMLPAIGLYVYLGTLAVDFGQILSGDATPSAAVWMITIVALLAITAVTLVLQRAAARALQRRSKYVA